MKSSVRYTLGIMLLLSIFFSCQKSDKDPILSFYTRKARVCADWKLEVGKTWYYNSVKDSSERIDIDSGHATLYISKGFLFPVIKKAADYRFKFEKNGTVTITKKIDSVGTTILKGNWLFMGENGDFKSKQQIKVIISSREGNPNVVTYDSFANEIVYEIVELKNKKMVLYVRRNDIASNGSIIGYSQEYTLTR